jgi:hypothetical protein
MGQFIVSLIPPLQGSAGGWWIFHKCALQEAAGGKFVA